MATTQKILLVTFTLIPLVLAAKSSSSSRYSVLAIFYGKARCKNNPSMVIRDAPLQLMVGNTTVPGTGKTTADKGKLLMMMELASGDQLAALVRGRKAVLATAPPDACGGAPQHAARTLASQLRLRVYGRMGSPSEEEMLSNFLGNDVVGRHDLHSVASDADDVQPSISAMDGAMGASMAPTGFVRLVAHAFDAMKDADATILNRLMKGNGGSKRVAIYEVEHFA